MVLSPDAAQRGSAVAPYTDPIVVAVCRPDSGTDADLAELLRLAVRAWVSDNAHYFGPLVADDAAARLARLRIAPLTHAVVIRRDDLLAWLHLAASH